LWRLLTAHIVYFKRRGITGNRTEIQRHTDDSRAGGSIEF
jgi:hypothetical protein